MKHIFAALVLTMACCSFSVAAEDGIEELCREVLNSIVADDPVAYAQCYSTNRHRKRQMSKLGLPLSTDDTQRLLGKFRQRNTTIRHSFRIMREQIPDPKAKIKFVSAEAKVKTETFRGLTITTTSQILLRFRVDDEEWVLHLDDGVLQDGQWFLSDDPVSLETPTKKILFRPSGRDKDGRIIYGRVIPLRA
ncbi:MAG: hypothetical protein HN467_03235 [Opitutae bacterium]|nr:hypothetical protein [Opitutae bacterium]